jgi:3-deoxy-D-manno-octulosonic-acid transferase
LYSFLIRIVVKFLEAFPLGELGRLVKVRKTLFQELKEHYETFDRSRMNIHFHVASFGELEQAKPIITRLKQQIPGVHIHLTFFSSSGYDNAYYKYKDADLITYLPLDIRQYSRRFLNYVQPDLVVFIRYDVWHNFAKELQERDIAALLICATFNRKKRLNNFTAELYKKTYTSLRAILAIRESDREALLSLGIENVEVAGDTRFDQVMIRKTAAESKPPILPDRIWNRQVLEHRLIIVAGSTWEKDEALLAQLDRSKNFLLIIVPHKTDKKHISSLQKQFPDAVLYSEIESFNSQDTIIVDSIGKLFELYRYADIAYVGGGFGAGVHNTLEPAGWGVPVVCGPKIERSLEISEMAAAGGATVISTAEELNAEFDKLLSDAQYRKTSAANAMNYVTKNLGAVDRILNVINEVPLPTGECNR